MSTIVGFAEEVSNRGVLHTDVVPWRLALHTSGAYLVSCSVVLACGHFILTVIPQEGTHN